MSFYLEFWIFFIFRVWNCVHIRILNNRLFSDCHHHRISVLLDNTRVGRTRLIFFIDVFKSPIDDVKEVNLKRLFEKFCKNLFFLQLKPAWKIRRLPPPCQWFHLERNRVLSAGPNYHFAQCPQKNSKSQGSDPGGRSKWFPKRKWWKTP